MNLDLAWKIGVAVFTAGGLLANYLRGQRDLKGLSIRQARRAEIDQRHYLAMLALALEDDVAERKKIVQDLLRKE